MCSCAKWGASRNIEVHCTCYTSPQELLQHITMNTGADVLFLDISLGAKEIDGMTLAKHIRQLNIEIPIIFVTADAQKAADGYLVEALGFLMKPIDEDRLFLYLDKVIAKQRKHNAIRIMADGHITNVYQSDILYVEIFDHTVTYHTTQADISNRGTLSGVLKILDNNRFIQIHRSYVIALDKIDSIKSTYPYSVNILTANETMNLPVSRKYIHALMKAFADGLWEKML